MKKEKITKPFTLVAAIYILYFILRVMDLFILRTDQTWVGEAIIHKLLGIVIMSIIACRLGFKPEEIGFSKGKSILKVFYGLAFGFAVYGIAYAAEIIMSKAAGSFDSLRFYVSAYAIDKNSGNRTGFLFFILCIIGNVINVLMEEGNFRGLFPGILGEKYAFAKAAVITSALFGFWHIVLPLRNYVDREQSFRGMIVQCVLLLVISTLIYEYGGSLFQQYHSQSFTRGDEYRCRRDDDCQDFHRSVSFLRPRAYLLLQMAENQCV